MKRKVAIIDTLGAHGGAFHFYTFGQSIGLINSAVDVSLYTNNETTNPRITGLKFFSFYKDVFASESKITNGVQWIIGSIQSIFHARFSGISIFHFHIFYTNVLVLFSLLLVKLLFGKVVLTIHDVSSFANSSDSSIIGSMIYKLTDLILTHNEFSKSEIVKINPTLSSCIYIVPHGNYIPFIHVQNDKEKSRQHLGIPNEKKVLLFFGMIKKVKGLDVLLHALKNVIKENPDVLLLIAGKPWENDFSNYQRIIDENNLSDYCLLHTKFIPHADVEHYYCAADLVVLPYNKIFQSGVLMMTLSYGKPTLVSDLPPLKEVVTDMQTAFLFESENPISLAEKLNLILLDPGKLEQVRINGEKLINTKYDWNEIGRQTKLAYQSLY
ncbi:MAG TPA: glycosyltransferase family 1 protein [Flavobacteriales bacterium]|nr:glycosyltransferase family 1 protein [Flavobacteriales bacterium]HIK63066.1 glycosyltransferase family 1 protein [Flavobacteriales bacterium]